MLEITKSGNWYSVEIECSGYSDVFKAQGTKAYNELMEDLAHDCILDEQTELAAQCINARIGK